MVEWHQRQEGESVKYSKRLSICVVAGLLLTACESGGLQPDSPASTESTGGGSTLEAGTPAPTVGEISASVASDPSSYGDDPMLDAAWDLCATGNWQACDELWWNSPPGSEYAAFGDTCGNLTGGGEWCEVEMAASGAATSIAAAFPLGPKPDGPAGYVPPEDGGIFPTTSEGSVASAAPSLTTTTTTSIAMGEVIGATSSSIAIGEVVGGASSSAGDSGMGVLVPDDPALAGEPPFTYGDDPALDALWDGCRFGTWDDCDSLFSQGAAGTHYQAYGFTCGGRIAHSNGDCEAAGAAAVPSPYDPHDYGDDSFLDNLWDRCAIEDWQACDDLRTAAPPGSNYWSYGMTCGNREPEFATQDDPVSCLDYMTAIWGSDPYLDALARQCIDGDFETCDELLVLARPTGWDPMSYERVALFCGDRAWGKPQTMSCVDWARLYLTPAWSYGDLPYLDGLYDECRRMLDGEACNALYWEATDGSDYWEFGRTCGDRLPGTNDCAATFYDWDLTKMYLLCESEIAYYWVESDWWSYCNDLYVEAPIGSHYEWFGMTCGGRTDGRERCSADMER